MRKPFIAGNWKMFKTCEEAREFCERFKELYAASTAGADTAIMAPFVHLPVLKEVFGGTEIGIGAQNVHYEDEGAFTGEVSAAMLKDYSVTHCIIGHSERREYFNETDETVNLKLKKLLLDGTIVPILCVGENLEQREAGSAGDIVTGQLNADFDGIGAEDAVKVVIAYEPIWAIGTGKTATPDQAQEMCKLIRSRIAEMYGEDIASRIIIQYGGSVKPENASEIMAMDDIDGALVGGASLKADSFIEIVDF